MNTQECMVCGDCKKQQWNTLMILLVGGAWPVTMSSSTTYLEVWYGLGSLERTTQRTGGLLLAIKPSMYITHFSLKF